MTGTAPPPVAVPAYCEVIDFEPEFTWRCNLCGRSVNDAPCPAHAPTQVPGLFLARCEVNPRHNVFLYANEVAESYGADCESCRIERLYALELRLRHAAHRRWQRSRLACRALRLAYRLCLINGFGTDYNAHCSGCITAVYPGNPIAIRRKRHEERALTRALLRSEA